MWRTRDEILERIRLGEDGVLECKDVWFAGAKISGPKQDDLADEIAAFANSRGGLLILGVKDSPRTVTGIPFERLDEVEALVLQACEDSIAPAAAPFIERTMLPNSTGEDVPVIRIEVARSLTVHRSPRGYLHRVGSAKRQLTPDGLARLFQQRSQSRLIRFDETPVPESSLDDLDDKLWRRYAADSDLDQREVLLSKLGMIAEDDFGTWRLTLAGLLLGTHAPEKYVPNAFIQAVAYWGTEIKVSDDSTYQKDARDIFGALDRQVLDACDFVRKNMQVPAMKSTEGGRIDLPQYDIAAVFEAVTNAVAHRDYSMTGSKIRLRMFDDRIELSSPGMLANSMSADALPYRQATRNETIASLLARCEIDHPRLIQHRRHFMDRRGEGVPLILARSEAISGRRPVYRVIEDLEVILTIYAADALPPKSEADNRPH